MAVSGTGSLAFGKLFDRFGIVVLLPLTIISALATPLVFLGGFAAALIGSALWGLGMGVHESIIPAAVATMYQRTGGRLRMACSPEPAVFSGFWEVQSSAFFMITLYAVHCVLAGNPIARDSAVHHGAEQVVSG
jgi:MFS family permease